MKIKYYAPRIKNEPEIYEVQLNKEANGQAGRLYFKKPEDKHSTLILTESRMKGSRKIKDYIVGAAKKLIREKKCDKVLNMKNEVVAELKTKESLNYP